MIGSVPDPTPEASDATSATVVTVVAALSRAACVVGGEAT